MHLRIQPIAKFSALQWFLWSSWATFGAFNVYHLTERGLRSSLIGLLISIMTFSGIIGQYVWGYLCDKLQTVKKVFMFCFLSLGVVVFFFPYYLSSPILLGAALGLIGFLWSPQPTILDSWTVETSQHLARNYGFTRGFGSVGFAIVAAVFGRFIAQFGWNIMFYSFAGLAVITVLVASTIPDSGPRSNVATTIPVNPKRLLR